MPTHKRTKKVEVSEEIIITPEEIREMILNKLGMELGPQNPFEWLCDDAFHGARIEPRGSYVIEAEDIPIAPLTDSKRAAG